MAELTQYTVVAELTSPHYEYIDSYTVAAWSKSNALERVTELEPMLLFPGITLTIES